ncbi:thymidylate synthase [Daedaleopsis nitida]|nr:thymidylate synthase [Daedaleopsis nitida]
MAAADKAQTRPYDEHQYLNLIHDILATGDIRPDRTGTGTLSIFAPQKIRFSLADSTLPLLTTKRTFLRGIVEEILWSVRGRTDAKQLSAKGVKIWDRNGSKEFLEKRGLGHRREGDLGPGVDQLQECIHKIRNDPTDRRIVLSAWNPAAISEMALPPCHLMCQFYVHLPPTTSDPITKPKLSYLMYQRSADLGLGIPFNIVYHALLTHMVAYVTDTEAHELVIQLGDAHVYRDHVDALKVQLEREPRPFPKLRWLRKVESIDDFTSEDIVVEGYDPYPSIAMKMSV